MAPRRLYALYEYDGGRNLSSHCSGHLRLLRPFLHPSLRGEVELRAGRRFDGGKYDAVIVERFWHGNIRLRDMQRLVADIRRSGSHFLYALDDNLFDLRAGLPGVDWYTDEHLTNPGVDVARGGWRPGVDRAAPPARLAVQRERRRPAQRTR